MPKSWYKHKHNELHSWWPRRWEQSKQELLSAKPTLQGRAHMPCIEKTSTQSSYCTLGIAIKTSQILNSHTFHHMSIKHEETKSETYEVTTKIVTGPWQSQDLNLMFKGLLPSTAPWELPVVGGDAEQAAPTLMPYFIVIILCLIGDAKSGASPRPSHEFSHAETGCIMPHWHESPRLTFVFHRADFGKGWQQPWERETSELH